MVGVHGNGDHENGYFFINAAADLSQGIEEFQAVHFRHEEVKEDFVRQIIGLFLVFPQVIECSRATFEKHDFAVAFKGLQSVFNDPMEKRVIINDCSSRTE